MSSHIIITGFGRSGTTWMSDIISKSLGGLVLFEPCHPQVCKRAKEWTYDNGEICAEKQLEFVNEITSSDKVHPWLLRNHLRHPLESVPEAYVNDIWKYAKVIGFKTIRWNHNINYLSSSPDTKVIYLLRHPLAVIASLLRRQAYWEEFGWSFHWESFLSRAMQQLPSQQRIDLLAISDELTTSSEKIAFMWAVSVSISLEQVKSVDGYIVKYEDIYLKPYEVTLDVLSSIGKEINSLHPSFIFEPSMTTHRTFHTEKERTEILSGFPEYFWKDTISSLQAESLLNLITSIARITKEDEILRYVNPN